MKRIFLAIMLLAFFAFPAFALEVKVDGVVVGGSFATQVNFTGDVTGSGAGSEKTINIGGTGGETVEFVIASTDTVVTADDETIFVSTESGTLYTLPAAAAGLKFTFVAGGSNTVVTVDTASASDTINYLSLDAGDKIQSAALASADSVTLVGDDSNNWYIVGMGSEPWIDGGS